MLVVGTNYEYFNAVWVKNEWSRFLKMLNEDKSKAIYPCYADMEPDDMPRKFKNLPKQNMQKVGFLQDLIHGIGKIISPEGYEQKTVQQISGPNVENLLKRGFIALQDEKWNEAEQCFDKVLGETDQCSEAYLGKTMLYYKANCIESLYRIRELSNNSYFKRAVQLGNSTEKEKYVSIQHENTVFFDDEIRRADMVELSRLSEINKINEIQATIDNNKVDFIQKRSALRNSSSPIHKHTILLKCIFSLTVFIVACIVLFAIVRGNDPEASVKGALFACGIVAILIGNAIANGIINSNEKSYRHNVVVVGLQNLENTFNLRSNELSEELENERNSFICCCCGEKCYSNTTNCKRCASSTFMPTRQALNMGSDEFRRHVLSDNAIPQNHNFMK